MTAELPVPQHGGARRDAGRVGPAARAHRAGGVWRGAPRRQRPDGGGKATRGPQSTGILAGRPDLVAAAAANNAPEQRIGRPLKVGKEELCGLVAAVERFWALDEAAQLAEWRGWCREIACARWVSGSCIPTRRPVPSVCT